MLRNYMLKRINTSRKVDIEPGETKRKSGKRLGILYLIFGTYPVTLAE